MAQDPQQNQSIAAIVQRIAHSRDHLARDLTGLRYELDFPLKFRKSFQRHWIPWMSGTAVFGALFSLLPARTKKIYLGGKSHAAPPRKMLEAGFFLGVVKIAGSLLKPLVISFLTKKFSAPSRTPKRTQGW